MNAQTKTKEPDILAEILGEAPTTNVPAIVAESHQAPLPRIQPIMPVTGIANIATAIATVMGEVETVGKRGTNKFHNYRYAQMQDILQELTPAMAKNGIVVIQTEIERNWLDNGSAVYVTYQFTIAHKSGEVWPEHPVQTGVSRVRDSKGGFDDKALNKCHTQARKYFLMALFQIATEDADDSDRGDNDRAPPPIPETPSKRISAAGNTLEGWVKLFEAAISKCRSVKDLDVLRADNDAVLDRIMKTAAPTYAVLMDLIGSMWATLRSANPETGEVWIDPQPVTDVPPPIPPQASAEPAKPASEPPKGKLGTCPPADQPEAFRKWLVMHIKKLSATDAVDEAWATYVEPNWDEIFPPDRADLTELFKGRKAEIEGTVK